MGKKSITILLGVLFVLCLTAGILGLLNKGKDTPKPVDNEESGLKLSSETIKVSNTSELFGSYEFVKANIGASTGVGTAEIDNGVVKLKLYFNGEEKEYSLSEIADAKAVQIESFDDNKVVVYVMNQSNIIYRFVVTKAEDGTISHTSTKYNLKNVDSFMSFGAAFESDFFAEPFIVIKTTDGKYLTDYLISETDTLTIREYVSENPTEETPVEETPVETQTEETPTETTVEENTTEEVPTTEETTTETTTEAPTEDTTPTPSDSDNVTEGF